MSRPIRGQYSGHVTSIDQSQTVKLDSPSGRVHAGASEGDCEQMTRGDGETDSQGRGALVREVLWLRQELNMSQCLSFCAGQGVQSSIFQAVSRHQLVI